MIERDEGNDAVSPVVGVMLMLVVTIIIAAVVSSFAGGLASETEKAPSVNLECTVVTSPIDRAGLLFENKGGDDFELSDLKMHLRNKDTQITVDYDSHLSTEVSTLASDITAKGRYFQKICPNNNYAGTDLSIRPGDKFMFYADAYQDGASLPWKTTPGLSWKPEGVENGCAMVQDSRCEYELIDKVSGQIIMSGEFIVP